MRISPLKNILIVIGAISAVRIPREKSNGAVICID